MSRTLESVVKTKCIEFKFKTTLDPNMLIIPRRRDMVKSFCEALAAELPQAGTPPLIFHKLWVNNDRAHYTVGEYVLEVVLSDKDDDLMVDYSPESADYLEGMQDPSIH